MSLRREETIKRERPDVFSYHEYRAFLRDWFDFLKDSRPGFSMRALAREAELASGFLPMILAGTRNLSAKTWAKMAPHLGLSPSERSYLASLQMLQQTDSQAVRHAALGKLQRFRAYREQNPKETETYQYLTRWFNVAIREMAALGEFHTNPEWIQSRLRVKVGIAEIKQALDFLTKNNYLEVQPDGTARLRDKNIDCVGGVYKMALGKFHREMLSLASQSIDNTPSEERNITGHTLAIPASRYGEIETILDEALQKIAALGNGTEPADCVYHILLSAFPLTVNKGRR